jgi:hypothetical protein
VALITPELMFQSPVPVVLVVALMVQVPVLL